MSEDVHVEHEPVPPPRPGARVTVGVHVKIVKDGEVINEAKTPYFFENERREREERKY